MSPITCESFFSYQIGDEESEGMIALCILLQVWGQRHTQPDRFTSTIRILVDQHTETVIDDMAERYEWDQAEIYKAEHLLAIFQEEVRLHILEIANSRTTHTQKKQRRYRTSMSDMKIATIIAYLSSLFGFAWEAIEDTFNQQNTQKRLPSK